MARTVLKFLRPLTFVPVPRHNPESTIPRDSIPRQLSRGVPIPDSFVTCSAPSPFQFRTMTDTDLLRVSSDDLFDHIVLGVGDYFDTGAFTDVVIRCSEGETLHAHKLVLAAVSPYLKFLLDGEDSDEFRTLEFPHFPKSDLSMLLEVIYKGSVEATMTDLRSLVLLAHSLYITIPISADLLSSLDVELPALPPAQMFYGSTVRPMLLAATAQQMLFQQQRLPSLSALKANGTSPKKRKLDPNPMEYTCPVCNSTYGNIGNFKQHMRVHEKDQRLEQKQQVIQLQKTEAHHNEIHNLIIESYNPDTQMYTCRLCKSHYNHSGNFKQHLLKHERESGNSVRNLLANLGFDPPSSHDPKPKSSPVEKKIKSSDNHLNSVLQSAFADRVDNGDLNHKYHCHHCGRSFKHPGNFKQHLSSHERVTTISAPPLMPHLAEAAASSTDGKRPCAMCNAEFSGAKALEAHMDKVHPEAAREKKFDCSFCKDKFAAEGVLHSHMFYTHGIKKEELLRDGEAADICEGLTYHCDIESCFQSFSKEGWLVRHKEKAHGIKAGENKFICTMCQKAFPKQDKLTAHMKIHSAPQEHYKYPCDICGKKFTRPQHVERHRRLHTGEKPFACNICGKSFAREDKLKAHAKNQCTQESNENLVGWASDESMKKEDDSNDGSEKEVASPIKKK